MNSPNEDGINEIIFDKFVKLSSTGKMDLKISIILTHQEAEKFNIYPEKIETISDCFDFLSKNYNESLKGSNSEQYKKLNIYDHIRLTSNNSTLNTLLFINKSFKKKVFIEFITMTEIKFREIDFFLKEFLKNVTEQNFLFIVENNFLSKLETKIKLEIKIDNNVEKSFENICVNNSDLIDDQNKEMENKNNKNIEEFNNKIEKNLTNENNNINIVEYHSINEPLVYSRISENKINKEDNPDDFNLENKSNFKNSEEEKNYNQMNINVNDINSNQYNQENKIIEDNKNPEENLNNLNESDLSAKKIINSIPNDISENKNINENEFTINKKIDDNNIENEIIMNKIEENEEEKIFIINEINNYDQKENKKEIPEIIKTQEKILTVYERFNYDFSGCDYFYIDMNEIIELNKFDFSISDFHELIKNIVNNYKEIQIIINYPNIINNISMLQLDAIDILNEIIGLTDIHIFDKIDALALFNLISHINSEGDNPEDKKNLEELFIKEVKKKRKSHPKIGIFLDEFKRVTIIEQQSCSNLILFHTDYEFNLFPMNLSKTVKEDYMKLLVVHYDVLKSVFLGGFLSRYLNKKSFNLSFSSGKESLKNILELFKYNLDFPVDPSFYLIKIFDNLKIPDEEEKLKQKKEQHFVLDCSNILTSKMKEYNPLYDQSLQNYYSSKPRRDYLKKLGFINKRGNILQDPEKKNLGVIENKSLIKIYDEEKNSLQKIKEKKEKLIFQMRNLMHENFAMKSGNIQEIKKLAEVYNFTPKSEKKLPSLNKSNKSNYIIDNGFKTNRVRYVKNFINIKKQKNKSKSPVFNPMKVNPIHKDLMNLLEKIEENMFYLETKHNFNSAEKNKTNHLHGKNNQKYLDSQKINSSNSNFSNITSNNNGTNKVNINNNPDISKKSSGISMCDMEEKAENLISRNLNSIQSKDNINALKNKSTESIKINLDGGENKSFSQSKLGNYPNKSIDNSINDISKIVNTENISKISKENFNSGKDLINISKRSVKVNESNINVLSINDKVNEKDLESKKDSSNIL